MKGGAIMRWALLSSLFLLFGFLGCQFWAGGGPKKHDLVVTDVKVDNIKKTLDNYYAVALTVTLENLIPPKVPAPLTKPYYVATAIYDPISNDPKTGEPIAWAPILYFSEIDPKKPNAPVPHGFKLKNVPPAKDLNDKDYKPKVVSRTGISMIAKDPPFDIRIGVRVDSTDVIDESHEDNNTKYVTVTVK
jgi:hypothetical protein